MQPAISNTVGQVEIFPEFAEGLQDLEGFSHIILFYVIHESKDFSLRVNPFLDDEIYGLFAMPCATRRMAGASSCQHNDKRVK